MTSPIASSNNNSGSTENDYQGFTEEKNKQKRKFNQKFSGGEFNVFILPIVFFLLLTLGFFFKTD